VAPAHHGKGWPKGKPRITAEQLRAREERVAALSAVVEQKAKEKKRKQMMKEEKRLLKEMEVKADKESEERSLAQAVRHHIHHHHKRHHAGTRHRPRHHKRPIFEGASSLATPLHDAVRPPTGTPPSAAGVSEQEGVSLELLAALSVLLSAPLPGRSESVPQFSDELSLSDHSLPPLSSSALASSPFSSSSTLSSSSSSPSVSSSSSFFSSSASLPFCDLYELAEYPLDLQYLATALVLLCDLRRIPAEDFIPSLVGMGHKSL
jgi:hypothetical protein